MKITYNIFDINSDLLLFHFNSNVSLHVGEYIYRDKIDKNGAYDRLNGLYVIKKIIHNVYGDTNIIKVYVDSTH